MGLTIEVDKDGNCTLKTDPAGKKLEQDKHFKFDKKKSKKWAVGATVCRYYLANPGGASSEPKTCHMVLYSEKDLDLKDGSKLNGHVDDEGKVHLAEVEYYCENPCEDMKQVCKQLGELKKGKTAKCGCENGPQTSKSLKAGLEDQIRRTIDYNEGKFREESLKAVPAIENARNEVKARTADLARIEREGEPHAFDFERPEHALLEDAEDRLYEVTDVERVHRLLLAQFSTAKAQPDLTGAVRAGLLRAQDDARNWKDEETCATECVRLAQQELARVIPTLCRAGAHTGNSSNNDHTELDFRRKQRVRNRAVRRRDQIVQWSRKFAATAAQWQSMVDRLQQAGEGSMADLARIIGDSQAAIAGLQARMEQLSAIISKIAAEENSVPQQGNGPIS